MQKPDSQNQISRFKNTARALDCDEDKDRFEAALGKIAAHKPDGQSAKAKSPSKRAKPSKPGS